jgi:Ca-activated chloride channel family protein
MAAEDFDGNKTRLSGVRKDIENLTNNLAGARFSIIYFDSNAYSALPFTTDTTAVITQAKTLNQEITYYSRGSSIDRPLDLLKAQFENAEKNKPERARMIVYFGDGEQTADSEPKSFSELKKYLDGGLVLGYGTASGGKMKEYSGYASDKELPYIKDYSSKAFPVPDALSKIDETNLQNIASQLGVQYQRRAQNTDTSALAKSLNVGKLVKKTRDVKGSTDLYWIMTIFVAALLLFDIKRILDMREELKIGKNHE